MASSNFWQFLRSFGRSWGTLVTGVLGIPLTVAAFYVEKDLHKTLWGILALFAVIGAAYLVWKHERDEVSMLRDRLAPKLDLKFNPFLLGCLHPTKTKELPEGRELLCVRVLVASSVRVSDCVGSLVGVHRNENGAWIRERSFAGSIPLNWADMPPSIAISPGAPHFLECLYVRQSDNKAEIAAPNPPEMNKNLFNSGELFKLDIVVNGSNGGEMSISFSFQLGATWDKPNVSELSSA